MTTAFVLGGGGLLGAHEVGMLRALADAGVRPDLVVGTSIGALNGVLVAADPAEAADRLARMWQGEELRLRGHGMPHLRSGVRGDLHAHIEVVVPSRLDHDDIELLHKLKEKRTRDVAEVRSTQSASAGSGFFSRLRETFTGR